MFLVVEGTEQGHAALDPVLLGLVGGDLHSKHEVGGVTGGGQRACKGKDTGYCTIQQIIDLKIFFV